MKYNPNIKFTTEIQNNKCINFLDALVDNSPTTVTTSTFRKPTNTGLYSKWSSFVPRRYKYNLVNCLLDRASKICSSYESISSEVDNIKVMLGRNGYPAYFLDSCVRRFFNRNYDKLLSHLEKRKNCKTVIAWLSFFRWHVNATQKRAVRLSGKADMEPSYSTDYRHHLEHRAQLSSER